MKTHILAAALASAALTLLPAQAAETDYSDLWVTPTESGWGAGIQRQGNVIFLTLFVYGADGASTWLVASDMRQPATTPSRWEGILYRASGPAFSGPYTGGVTTTQVGTARLEFTGPSSGTLRYTVDGVEVVKAITRLTWAEPSMAGRYHGGYSSLVTSCTDPTRVGEYDFLGTMDVTQNGRAMTAVATYSGTGGNSRCTYTGELQYSGRLASWSGTFSCSIYLSLDYRGENPVSTTRRGNFSVGELAISATGFYGNLTASDQDCAFTGYFGGTRLP